MKRSKRALLFVVFVVVALTSVALTRAYLMDDALITLRYARHLAESGHATWNRAGSEAPLVGYTSIAWMMILSATSLVVIDADALIVCAKSGAAAALLLVAWLFADKLARSRASMSTCIAFGLLLFANGGHGLHANSAMETMLFSALTLLVVWSRDRGQASIVGYLWGSLAILARPEGVLLLLVLAWFDLRAGKTRAAILGCGVFAISVAATLAALTLAYKSPIPSALAMKLGGPYPKRYGALSVAFFAMLCAPGFLAACFLGARARHETSKLAFTMAATLLSFLVFVRPIMSDCFRYQWPALYWLAFGALPILEDEVAVGRRLLFALGACTFVLNVRTSFIALRLAKDDFTYAMDRNIGLTLAHSMRPGDWLSVVDAGMVPYFSDVPTHDAVGLADGAAVIRGAPYFAFVGALLAFCRPDVGVAIIGVSDDDEETPRVLHACGFWRRVDVPISRCGPHWLAKVVFARDGVPLDRAALVSGRDFLTACPWDVGDTGSWTWWLSWDGATG
jgi:arabinofuranosyltransferase